MREIKYKNGSITIGSNNIPIDDHYLAFEEMVNIGDCFYIKNTRRHGVIDISNYRYPSEGEYYAFYKTVPAEDNGSITSAADAMLYFLENEIPFVMSIRRCKEIYIRYYSVVKGRSSR